MFSQLRKREGSPNATIPSRLGREQFAEQLIASIAIGVAWYLNFSLSIIHSPFRKGWLKSLHSLVTAHP
jgi:hypothetical protein